MKKVKTLNIMHKGIAVARKPVIMKIHNAPVRGQESESGSYLAVRIPMSVAKKMIGAIIIPSGISLMAETIANTTHTIGDMIIAAAGILRPNAIARAIANIVMIIIKVMLYLILT